MIVNLGPVIVDNKYIMAVKDHGDNTCTLVLFYDTWVHVDLPFSQVLEMINWDRSSSHD